MIEYENECVGCPAEISCIGDLCPYRNVKHLYCDCCGEEDDILYEYEGQELCLDCLLDRIPNISAED